MWVTRRFVLGGEMCFIICVNCSVIIMKNLYPSKCLFSEHRVHFIVLVWNSGHILFTVVVHTLWWVQPRKKRFSHLVFCFAPGHLTSRFQVRAYFSIYKMALSIRYIYKYLYGKKRYFVSHYLLMLMMDEGVRKG